MSGDVQPRKRKDKKKKRDVGAMGERKSEEDVTFARHGSIQDDESSHGVHITKMGADDMHLHVQHEHGTGGHWCAKIVFFFLMAVLVGLVSLIIMENRDSTDVDTPLSESRFSTYFQGWVDEHRQDEHEHDHDDLEQHDDHEDHDDHDDHDMLENDDDDDQDDHEHVDDEEDEGHDEDKSKHEYEDEDEHADQDEDGDEQEDDGADEDEDEDDEENDGDSEIEMEKIINDDDDDDIEGNKAREFAQFDRKADDDDNEDEDDNDENNDDDDNNDDGEDDMDDNYHDNGDIDGEDDEDFDDDNENDNDEDYDQIIDNDAGEIELLKERARQQAAAETANKYKQQVNDNDHVTANADDDTDDEANNAPSWANALLTKIGIGFALAFVARLVLIKKNARSTSEVTNGDKELVKRHLTNASEMLSEVKEMKQKDEDVLIAVAATATAKSAVPKMHSMPTEMDYSEEEVEIVEEIEYIGGEAEEKYPGTGEMTEIIKNPIDDNVTYKSETGEKMSVIGTSKNDDISDEINRNDENTLKSTESVQQTPSYNISAGEGNKGKLPQERRIEELIPEMKSVLKNDDEETFNESDKDIVDYDEDDIYEEDENGDNYNDDYDNAEMNDTDSDELNDIISLDDDNIDVDDEEEDDVECEGEGDEYEEDAEDDISDIDDTELMNRLEAKYGKLPVKSNSTSEDDDDSHVETLPNIKPDAQNGNGPKAILSDDNEYDTFEKELRRANEELMRQSYNQAVQTLKKLKEKYPKRSQLDLSLARALDAYAEEQKSNILLMSAIVSYQQYLQVKPHQTKLNEYKEAARRCLERMTFLGDYNQMIPVLKQLIKQFPQDLEFYNQLVITYILLDRISDAKVLVRSILEKWPGDGLAAVHYGFILKQYDKNLEEAVIYLEQGLATRANGTQHGRFYFHLGDALQRLGRGERARQIYKEATDLKLFPSIYQRSLYNEPNLRAQPFWSKVQTGYDYWFDKIEKNWLTIRAEGLNALQKFNAYQNETENLTKKGEWQQFELFISGQKIGKNCLKASVTCRLIEAFPAARNCLRGQVKFSVMQGGTHVWPHCGPTNCRLRAHLGLIIPPGTFVRVAEEQNTWQEGKFLIFDDSFEHEVWHNGTGLRLILIIDVWHPDLTAQQRYSLSSL